MSTPLKQKIAVQIDNTENAVLLALMFNCGTRLIPYMADNLKSRGIPCTEKQLENLAAGLRGEFTEIGDYKICKALEAQGIDWRTWQPEAPLSIGGYPVEFKPHCIKVGCKTIPHATVKAITERLEKPVGERKSAAINVHGDPQLSQIVQQLGFDAGYTGYEPDSVVNIPGTRFLKPTYKSLVFGGGNRMGGNSSHWPEYFQLNIDALTDFKAVLDFFRQPAVPEIKVENEPVKFNADSIEVFGETVSKETVGQILKRMEAA